MKSLKNCQDGKKFFIVSKPSILAIGQHSLDVGADFSFNRTKNSNLLFTTKAVQTQSPNGFYTQAVLFTF